METVTISEAENYYCILGCGENAEIEEIKRCYREKALASHPDKHVADSTLSFEAINKAWKTLSNPETRRIYDAKLNEERHSKQCLVFGTFSPKDLTYDSSNNTYSQTCRCGGLFVIDGVDMCASEDCDVAVECDTCSLLIYIKVH